MCWSDSLIDETWHSLSWCALMERRAWFGRLAQTGLGGGAMLGLVEAAVAVDPDEGPSGDAMHAVAVELGASDATLTASILVDVPAAAWTGSMVSVRIDARALPNVRQLHLLREDHLLADIASLTLAKVAGTRTSRLPALVSLPVRIERPCRLRVLVLTDAGWFRQDARVREVGRVGCGSDSEASSK